jgi:hypothetical protein
MPHAADSKFTAMAYPAQRSMFRATAVRDLFFISVGLFGGFSLFLLLP